MRLRDDERFSARGRISEGRRGPQGEAKNFAELVRPLLEEDDLAGLSAHATARELNRRGVPTPRGGAWTANSVLRLKARLPNRGPADHPIEGPSE